MMLSVLLLGFGVSLSVAIPHDILITAGPSVNLQPRATPAGGWTFGPECTSNSNVVSLVSKLNHPPDPSFSESAFCSEYLQGYAEAYAPTTHSGASTVTETQTTTTSTTTRDTRSQTTTLICATPSPSALCGVAGTFSESFLEGNLIVPSPPNVENGEACKQLCLRDKACKSFVTYGSTEDGTSCDMYNATLATGWLGDDGTEGNGNHWFDRSCPDLQPAACLSKKKVEKRFPVSIPPWLANDGWYQSAACSCIVTSALPTTTRTISYDVYESGYTTTTKMETETKTSTTLLHVTTTYTFVQR